jgi:hypothetical protein
MGGLAKPGLAMTTRGGGLATARLAVHLAARLAMWLAIARDSQPTAS